jgi:hypothetical protein
MRVLTDRGTKYCYGETPIQTWKDSLHQTNEKLLDTLNQYFVSFSSSNEVETIPAGSSLNYYT